MFAIEILKLKLHPNTKIYFKLSDIKLEIPENIEITKNIEIFIYKKNKKISIYHIRGFMAIEEYDGFKSKKIKDCTFHKFCSFLSIYKNYEIIDRPDLLSTKVNPDDSKKIRLYRLSNDKILIRYQDKKSLKKSLKKDKNKYGELICLKQN